MNAAVPLAASLAAASAGLAVAGLSRRSDGAVLAALAGERVGGARSPIRRVLVRVGRSPAGRLAGGRSPLPDLVLSRTWGPSEIAGAKVLAPAVVGGLASIGPGPLPLVSPLLAVAAYRLPDLLVARAVRRRTALAARELPVFLDLLAVATSAGLAPQLAVREAVVAVRGPLGDELRSALRAADLGGRWRDELGAAAKRIRVPALGRTVSVLARSEWLGSSLAGEVGRLAVDVRESRRAVATERARTAPVKMLFPLVFLILPAFLLLTVVPVLLTTVRSIA